jgi:hypothetical protein
MLVVHSESGHETGQVEISKCWQSFSNAGGKIALFGNSARANLAMLFGYTHSNT